MNAWAYRARTIDGQIREGIVQALSEAEAARSLIRNKLIPEWVKPDARERSAGGIGFSLRRRVKPMSMVFFARQFATLIDAAVPLVQSLEILSELTDDKILKKTLDKVVVDVQAGKTLAAAMREHPNTFSDIFVNMVEAGEQGGMLDTILARLATYLEKSQEIVSKVKTAMVYPMIILIVALLSAVVMLTFVVPTFETMFASGGMTLPYPTQLLLNLSAFVQARWMWLLGGTFGGVFLISNFYRTPTGRELGDRILLRIPVLGDLIHKTAIARFSQSMASLLTAGSNLIDALEAAAATTDNVVIEKALLSTRPAIEAGEGISKPLSQSGVVPNLVSRMVDVGETTGRLDDMFEKVSIFYEGEVDTAVTRLMKAMEPALIVVVGVILGGMVMALYLPIFTAMTTVDM
ncbi:MAG: type II secretion system F family protein [Acidimicrobiia bacterium]